MHRGLLLLVLLATAAGVWAYQLAYKDPVDAVRWYRTDITLDGKFTANPGERIMRMTGSIAFTSRETVTAVDDDGVATILSEIIDGTLAMTVDDQEMTQPLTDYRAVYKRAPSGKIIAVKIERESEGDVTSLQTMGFANHWRMISGLGQGFEFPAKDLKTGAKWRSTGTAGEVEMTVDTVLRKPTTVDGVHYLTITSDTSVKIPDIELVLPVGDQAIVARQTSSLKAKSDTLFDPDKGEFFKTDFTGEMKLHMSVPGAEKPLTVSGALKLSGSTHKIPPPERSAQAGEPAEE